MTERMLTMAEFIEAVNTDRIIEVFGCGTACMIAPIDSLLYEGKVCKNIGIKSQKCRELSSITVVQNAHSTIF